MNTRRLSLAGAVTVSAALLAACTAPPAPLPPGSDALAYVELLRGENDLAHGSLEVPATSSLPDAAAALRALRYAGRDVPTLGDDTLTRLAERTGDEPGWVAWHLCEATGDDRTTVERVLGEEAVRDILATRPSTARSANDVTDRIALESARRCLGDAVTLDPATRATLEEHAAGNALVGAHLVGLYDDLGHEAAAGLLDAADASRVAAAIGGEGCTEWVFAHSVAALRLGAVTEGATDGASRSIRECARSTTVTLTEPASLVYAIDAGLAPEQTALLLDHNVAALDGWLAVEPRTATAGDLPIGLGTVASTRDAIALLRLRGVVDTPDWVADGIVAASTGEIEPADRTDLLHACTILEVACDPDFVSHATGLLDDGAATVVDDVRSGRLDDYTGARLVETAIALGIFRGEHCAHGEAGRLYDGSPQVLATIATVEKACVETLELDDRRLAADIESALDELRPEDALALCLLHSLAHGTDSGPSTITTRTRAALDRLWLRFDAEHGEGFLRSARPLRVELLTAKADQWLE